MTPKTEHCIGQTISGLEIVYLPRHGYAGSDLLRYTEQMPRLHKQRTYTVNVIIEPDTLASPAAVPGDIAVPADDVPQSPGTIPACPAVVS